MSTTLEQTATNKSQLMTLKAWTKVYAEKMKGETLMTAKQAIEVITAMKHERKDKRSRIYREGLSQCNINIDQCKKNAFGKTSFLIVSNVRKGLSYPFPFKGEPKLTDIQTYLTAKLVRPERPKLAKGTIYKTSQDEANRGLYLVSVITDKGKVHTIETSSSALECITELYRFTVSEMLRTTTNVSNMEVNVLGVK